MEWMAFRRETSDDSDLFVLTVGGGAQSSLSAFRAKDLRFNSLYRYGFIWVQQRRPSLRERRVARQHVLLIHHHFLVDLFSSCWTSRCINSHLNRTPMFSCPCTTSHVLTGGSRAGTFLHPPVCACICACECTSECALLTIHV